MAVITVRQDVLTFPAEKRHRPSASTKLYCWVTEAHGSEQLAQGCYSTALRPGLKLATTESPCSLTSLPLDYRVTLRDGLTELENAINTRRNLTDCQTLFMQNSQTIETVKRYLCDMQQK